VTSDGSYIFTYDALGQPLSKKYGGDSTKLEYYVYTPRDKRIGVQRGAWWWWSVRDESGKVQQYKSLRACFVRHHILSHHVKLPRPNDIASVRRRGHRATNGQPAVPA
jgi:hypothetical protein